MAAKTTAQLTRHDRPMSREELLDEVMWLLDGGTHPLVAAQAHRRDVVDAFHVASIQEYQRKRNH